MDRPATKTPKVLLALEMANAAGRQQLIGIFRFLGSTMRWDIRIVQPPTELTEEHVRQSEREGYDGIITALPCSDVGIRQLAKSNIPIILLDIEYPQLPQKLTCTIRVDDRDIARHAANYFQKLGTFNGYCYLPAPGNPSWSIRRERAFRNALAKSKLPLNVFKGGSSSSETRSGLQGWLKSLRKPAAILCANDTCAGQLLSACHSANIDVPSHVSVLSVDDDEYLCGLTRPSLSSIRPDFENEGFYAAQELSRLMSGRMRSKLREIPAIGIGERDSTHQIASGNALVNRAVEFIRLNARRNITVTSVVAHLGVSRRLADLRFRQFEGRTILETITYYRLETVKRLLRESKSSISSITRVCGFSSEGYLKELFHRKCGLSMREYRVHHGL